MWTCEYCRTSNDVGFVHCRHCGAPRKVEQLIVRTHTLTHEWVNYG